MRYPQALLLLLPLLLLSTTAGAAELPVAAHAWYRDDGIRLSGADVAAWANAGDGGDSRALTRVVGRPQAVRVKTPTGQRTIVRFNGSSALWQPASGWGTLAGERTVVVYAHLPAGKSGVLFDGSTRAGSTPAAWTDNAWKTNAVASAPAAGQWQAHNFAFKADSGPTGGFILGANVATQQGLACDVAEVLVYPRALTADELKIVGEALSAKWGSPTDLPAAEQPQPAVRYDDPRVFRTTLRKAGDEGVHTYRIPGLATTPKGTLIAVFDARNKSGADLPGDIDVAMMRSTDDGATWSAMSRIIDFDAAVPGSRGNGVGDPAVLVDQKTGTIFVVALWSKGARAWFGSGPGMSPDETGQFVLVKSTDDGLTWSKPVSITPQIKDPAWRLCFNGPGSGIQLRDGTLVFPAQFKRTRAQPGEKDQVVAHACFIASSDGGETWKISPAAIPDGPQTSESAIVELADGSLLLSMRNESVRGLRTWARWEWKGDLLAGKWSEHWSAVTDPTCMASIIRHPHGELIFSNPNNPQRRVALTVRSSADSGRTWSAGRLLDPSGAMYSCLTVLRDGRIGVLYESVDAGGLVFARFPLDWVLEGASLPDVPEARTETTGKFGWWPARHAAKVAESKQNKARIVFLGDSITQGWETAGKAVWQERFAPRQAANYGFGGDSTQHVLWRVKNGEFDGITPKAVVLLIGTNNVRHGDFTPEQIAGGVRAVVDALGEKCPNAKVLVLGILPRGPDAADPLRRKCEAVNALLPALADGRRVHYLNINSKLLQPDGSLSKEISPDLLHLSAKGYAIVADAIEPTLKEWVGE
jgi:sialidase-1